MHGPSHVTPVEPLHLVAAVWGDQVTQRTPSPSAWGQRRVIRCASCARPSSNRLFNCDSTAGGSHYGPTAARRSACQWWVAWSPPPTALAPMAASGDVPSLPVRLLLAGCSSCTAAWFTNPIDVIKVRLQLNGELNAAPAQAGGWYATGSRIVQREGVTGLWKGIVPSLLREGSYSALRLGLYEPIKALFNATGLPESYALKLGAGGVAGCVGAALTTPTDLLKVQIQADATGTSTVRSVVRRVYGEGGLGALWRGTGPNVQRAALLTASQVGSYDETKAVFKARGWMAEGLALHCVASVTAGFVAAVVTSPVDTAKTRIMNQRAQAAAAVAAVHVGAGSGVGVGEGTIVQYKSTVDCMRQTVAAEGLAGLYKGFWPQWLRIGPHTIITFIVFERLRRVAGMKPM